MMLLMIVLLPPTMSPPACSDKSPPTRSMTMPPVSSFMTPPNNSHHRAAPTASGYAGAGVAAHGSPNRWRAESPVTATRNDGGTLLVPAAARQKQVSRVSRPVCHRQLLASGCPVGFSAADCDLADS